MCGLAGYLVLRDDRNRAPLGRIAGAMARKLVHRGPDDEGIWVDEAAGAALSHRRLSVVDLSPEGHQPMTSRSGRFVLVFNGEIYNYKSLRAELERAGKSFRGTSDTEVMLAGFERWGYETTLDALNGMFAIALWDRSERRLHLARDRMGEKPLYYGVAHGAFAFASELKALRALGWVLETDAVAWRIPIELKTVEGSTKWPLRQVLFEHVPRELVERPKQGFAVPIGAWLRGPLKGWALDVLQGERVRQTTLLDEPRVARWLDEHLTGTRNWEHHLWRALMLLAWHQESRPVLNGEKGPVPDVG